MSSTFKERLDKNLELVQSKHVSTPEAVTHMYLWLRFEYVAYQRERYDRKLHKAHKKLSDSIEVYMLRFRMEHYEAVHREN